MSGTARYRLGVDVGEPHTGAHLGSLIGILAERRNKANRLKLRNYRLLSGNPQVSTQAAARQINQGALPASGRTKPTGKRSGIPRGNESRAAGQM
jgi:hypothetical protein